MRDRGNLTRRDFLNGVALGVAAGSSLSPLELLAATGVAVAPGIDFDTVDGPRSIRFSFAGQARDVETGLERLAGFLGR